jgi:uncharacterized protein (TIGR03067 family)
MGDKMLRGYGFSVEGNSSLSGGLNVKRRLLLVVAAGLFLAADDSREAAIKKDRAAMQGNWKVASVERDGAKPYGDEQLAVVRVAFDTDGTLTVEANGSVFLKATTKIDPTTKPKSLDLTFAEGDMKGDTALAIYDIEGDTFRYCRAEPGKERPKEFSAKEGSGHMLIVYKRVK